MKHTRADGLATTRVTTLEGTNLKSVLEDPKVEEKVKVDLRRRYEEGFTQLLHAFEEKYPGTYLFVKGHFKHVINTPSKEGGNILIWLHEENILVHPKTLKMTIIDPH
jgi:hypothetical protein